MRALIKNGQVIEWPYTKAHLQADNPNTSFPKFAPFVTSRGTVVDVQVLPQPEAGDKVVERASKPVQDGDAWVLGWITRDKTADEIDAEREAMITTREAFAVKAALAGVITDTEALDWVGGTKLPASVDRAFAAITDRAERLAAKANALATTTIRRKHPLIVMLQSQFGLSDAQADELFK